MLRPAGKAAKIAEKVLKSKGIKVRKPNAMDKTKVTGPYLQQ